MLEPRAITAAIFIASLILSVTLWRVARTSPLSGPGRVWAVASSLASAGVVLNASQVHLPFWLALMGGNVAMVGGMALILMGLRQAVGLRTPALIPVGAMLLMGAATWQWGWVDVAIAPRVFVYSALVVGMSLVCVHAVQRIQGVGLYAAKVYLTIPLLLLALALTVRAGVTWAFGASAPSEPNLMNVATYIVGGAAFLALQTGFILLHQMLLAEKVRLSSERDALTGLLNRRGLHTWFSKLDGACSLLALDVDHFKRLNDSAGHAAGDACLAYLGQYLQRQLRQHDAAVRMGGEEFAVLLPQVALADALRIAQRIRCDLATDSQAQTGHAFTVSMGVTALGHGESFDAVWHRADAALYRAKHQGRNRCEVATPDGESLSRQ